jgi:hypothetical protein
VRGSLTTTLEPMYVLYEVQEYSQGGSFHIYRIVDELDGREVLPSFRYALRDLFA